MLMENIQTEDISLFMPTYKHIYVLSIAQIHLTQILTLNFINYKQR